MSALGQKRTFGSLGANGRFGPKAVIAACNVTGEQWECDEEQLKARASIIVCADRLLPREKELALAMFARIEGHAIDVRHDKCCENVAMSMVVRIRPQTTLSD